MKLSVVIPAYNASNFISSTLDAILLAKDVSLEIIVVDDGSTDGLSSVLERYVSENQVSLIRQKNSGSPASPRNRGFEASSGDYVLFLDADDVVITEEIAPALEALENSPDAAMICSNFHVTDENLHIRIERNIDRYLTLQNLLTVQLRDHAWLISSEDAVAALLQSNFVGTSSVIARRSALLDVGPFDESLRNLDDRDMWIRLAQAGPILYRDAPFYLYRDAPGSISKQRELQQFLERVAVADKVLRVSKSVRIRLLARSWRARNLLIIGNILTLQGARFWVVSWAFARSFLSKPSFSALRGLIKSLIPRKIYRLISICQSQRG